MLKKNNKIIFLVFSGFFIGIFSFFCLVNFVFAESDLHGATDAATKMGLRTDTDISTLIGSLTGTAFSFITVIFFLLAVYAGILWMTARGNEDQADRAKKTIIGAVIGLVLVVAAYAITNFVFDTTDFNAGSETQKYTCGKSANWQCVDLAYAGVRCKGEKINNTDYAGNLMSVDGDTIQDQCKNSEFCEPLSDCLNNQVCCELYVSPCQEVYGNNYSCVDADTDCTDTTTKKYEDGLCDSTQICCLQKQVWCLEGDESSSYSCIPNTGNCQAYPYHIEVNNLKYFESKTACESSDAYVNNQEIFCFYLSGSEFKCEAMKKADCVNETNKGQTFDRIGDCEKALEGANN